jgi:hypothetical protein
MKIKIFEGRSTSVIEEAVNKFIADNNAVVKQIAQTQTNTGLIMTVVYDEMKNNNEKKNDGKHNRQGIEF